MRNKKIRMMTIDAMFIALIAVFSFVPNLGFIPLGFVSITTIPVIVFLGALIFGWKRGLLYGTTFGLLSFINAITIGSNALDPFFINPLISVLPRALWGFFVGFLAESINKEVMKKQHWILFIFVPIMSFVHSLLVLFMLGLFNPDQWQAIGVVLGSVSLFEAIGYTIIVPILVISLQPVIKRFNLNPQM